MWDEQDLDDSTKIDVEKPNLRGSQFFVKLYAVFNNGGCAQGDATI